MNMHTHIVIMHNEKNRQGDAADRRVNIKKSNTKLGIYLLF